MIRTPLDRATATAQGSAIWRVYMKSWGDQIDELVADRSYLDALSLLDTLDVAVAPDKVNKTFVATGPVLILHRLTVALSYGRCMRSRYSRTGSMTKRSTSSSNSIQTRHRSFRYTQSLSPVVSLPLRGTGSPCLVVLRKRSLLSVNQNPWKSLRRQENYGRLEVRTNKHCLRLLRHRVPLLRSEAISPI